MAWVDDKCLESIVSVIEGKTEVSDEVRQAMVQQLKRLIWVDREKVRQEIRRREAPRNPMKSSDVVIEE